MGDHWRQDRGPGFPALAPAARGESRPTGSATNLNLLRDAIQLGQDVGQRHRQASRQIRVTFVHDSAEPSLVGRGRGIIRGLVGGRIVHQGSPEPVVTSRAAWVTLEEVRVVPGCALPLWVDYGK